MENLKIKINNEDESKEAQELFFELGYKWFSGGKNIQHLEQSCSSGFGYLVAWSTGCFTNVIQCGCGAEDAKEITLQELRDMVVLKRESINDQYAEIEQVRKKTIDATLAERQSQYGSFEDVAFVTENIIATLAKVRSNGLQDLPHTHRMALYMIASKMARIVNGDFNHLDSWHDIGGYSKLIEDLITVDQ